MCLTDDEKLESDDYTACASCDTILHVDDAYFGVYGDLCEGCSEGSG